MRPWKAEGPCPRQRGSRIETGTWYLHSFSLLSPCSLASCGPGGTLWSHLRSQASPQQSRLRSVSSLERMKAQLNSCLSLRTPMLLPLGRTCLQDRVPQEHPQTCQSLPPDREASSIRPQREAEGEPSARISTSCSSNLPKAPSGLLHLQSRRRPGQNLDTGSPWGLPWVREGAGRVLGGCGRSRGTSRPSADEASLGSGRGAWSASEEQVKQWAAEMLVALEALHEQGVLCRDLNPRNLLLDQAGRCLGLGGGKQATLPCLTPQVGVSKASARGEFPKVKGMAEVICFFLHLPSAFSRRILLRFQGQD